MIYKVKGGKRDGKCIDADFRDGNRLYKQTFSSERNVAADGSVMISKVVGKPSLVFEANRDEKIEELE